MVRKITGIFLLLGLFLAGWWLGRRSVGGSVVEHTRIDTVFFSGRNRSRIPGSSCP